MKEKYQEWKTFLLRQINKHKGTKMKSFLHFKRIYLIEWFFIGVRNENVKPQSLNTF